MGQEAFNYGLQYGLIWAFIFGFTFGRIRSNRTAMGSLDKPLNTVPAAAQAGSTPRAIVQKSKRAGFLYIFWMIALIIEVIVFWLYTLYLQGFFATYC